VVAVDIGTWNLLGESVEGPTAKTADRLVAALAWKRPWPVTLLEAYGGRLAIEATMEPPGRKVASGGGIGCAVAKENPPKSRKTCRETPGDCCGLVRGFDEGRRVLDGGRGDRLACKAIMGLAHNSPSPSNLNQIFSRLYPLSAIFETGRLGDTLPNVRCRLKAA
jgi:hypothetical protein